MEILNGRIEKVVGRSKIKALDMGRSNSHYCNRWILRGLIISCLLSATGCSTLKSSLMTAGATTAVVGVASVLTPSVIVPAIAGGTVAAVASALTAEPSVKGEPISVTADTVVNKAPDNFWTLLGKLISMGGWALILIVIVPMIFSWLMPGPIQFKGKKKNGS
jgi:pheromone shutdown protein TraB